MHRYRYRHRHRYRYINVCIHICGTYHKVRRCMCAFALHRQIHITLRYYALHEFGYSLHHIHRWGFVHVYIYIYAYINSPYDVHLLWWSLLTPLISSLHRPEFSKRVPLADAQAMASVHHLPHPVPKHRRRMPVEGLENHGDTLGYGSGILGC